MEDIDKYYNKAAAYCSKAEHCAYDVKEKLCQWGVQAPQTVALILEQLCAEKYLSEERYIRAFVRDKFRFNKWGKMKIFQNLSAKQLDLSLAEEIFAEEVSYDDYTQLLERLLKEKLSTLSADDSQLLPKLIRFAMGRGFEYNHIRKVIDDITSRV